MTAFSIKDFNVSYGKRQIIHSLSMDGFIPGQVVAVLGSNGCGKSSLLKALAGLVHSTGQFMLDGRDLATLPHAERAALIGYLPQNLPEELHLTVLESILAASSVSSAGLSADIGKAAAIEQVCSLLESLGIAHLGMHYLDQLSGGQRQLVGLAQTIIRQPRLLLLDEPLSALDMNYQFHVMELIRRETRARQLTSLIVLHDINVALRHCEQVMVIKQGHLLAYGEPHQVLTPELLAQAYGVQTRLEYCSRGLPFLLVDGLEQSSLATL